MSPAARKAGDCAGHGAMAVIRGQVVAEQVVRAVGTGTAGPDVLNLAFATLHGDGHAQRGFHRGLQKALEARAAALNSTVVLR